MDGVHTKKIREREQKPAPQKPPSQKFSSHLPGREDARTISAIVGKRYRRLTTSGTVCLFGDNCDIYDCRNRMFLFCRPGTSGGWGGCPCPCAPS